MRTEICWTRISEIDAKSNVQSWSNVFIIKVVSVPIAGFRPRFRWVPQSGELRDRATPRTGVQTTSGGRHYNTFPALGSGLHSASVSWRWAQLSKANSSYLPKNESAPGKGNCQAAPQRRTHQAEPAEEDEGGTEQRDEQPVAAGGIEPQDAACLLYTSPSPRDRS